jgi:hypothetical protein
MVWPAEGKADFIKLECIKKRIGIPICIALGWYEIREME